MGESAICALLRRGERTNIAPFLGILGMYNIHTCSIHSLILNDRYLYMYVDYPRYKLPHVVVDVTLYLDIKPNCLTRTYFLVSPDSSKTTSDIPEV